MPDKAETLRTAIAVAIGRVDKNTDRIENIEKLLAEHLTACTKQQEELAQIMEFLADVNASLRVANIMRRFLIWVSGIVAAIYGIYSAIKGG